LKRGKGGRGPIYRTINQKNEENGGFMRWSYRGGGEVSGKARSFGIADADFSLVKLGVGGEEWGVNETEPFKGAYRGKKFGTSIRPCFAKQ